MSENFLVLSTIDDAKAAEQIAEKLVELQLAACINIIPNLTSIYKWEGHLESANEQLLLIKTAGDRLEKLMEMLVALHPYELPEIIAVPLKVGYPPYLEWLYSGTRTIPNETASE